MRGQHALGVLLIGAIVGVTIFALLVRGATTTEVLPSDEAEALFEDVLSEHTDVAPLLTRDDAGALVRSEAQGRPGELTKLCALAYRARDSRVIRVDSPFWFIKLKGPAIELALRPTGFNLRDLQLTAEDLERHGAGIIIDERLAGGDRILIWTE